MTKQMKTIISLGSLLALSSLYSSISHAANFTNETASEPTTIGLFVLAALSLVVTRKSTSEQGNQQ